MKNPIPLPSPKNIPLNPQSAADSSLKMLITAWSDYKKISEVEITKRSTIAAWKEVNINQIESQREILEQFLTLTFKERAGIITGFFNLLDKGIDDNNSYLIDKAIVGIVAIAKESPLKQASEILRAINDPNIKSIGI